MKKHLCEYCKTWFESKLGKFCPHCARFQPDIIDQIERELLLNSDLIE